MIDRTLLPFWEATSFYRRAAPEKKAQALHGYVMLKAKSISEAKTKAKLDNFIVQEQRKLKKVS
ncbi:hypothetical protein IZ6_24530 [Terrihabitans soli]|uniref:Uncharacterized protein n=1 Tax=Terrihabitans soli TaxID=708113 RepID=A0A6S6QYQ6_9HYPH|nr:hypothetical protein [Terrihabitans soli]BCJ91718.1 hypothetical protein IZ6_24530 [Terrihabitans soli]